MCKKKKKSKMRRWLELEKVLSRDRERLNIFFLVRLVGGMVLPGGVNG